MTDQRHQPPPLLPPAPPRQTAIIVIEYGLNGEIRLTPGEAKTIFARLREIFA